MLNLNDFKISVSSTRTKYDTEYKNQFSEQEMKYLIRQELLQNLTNALIETKLQSKDKGLYVKDSLELLVMTCEDFYTILKQEINKYVKTY